MRGRDELAENNVCWKRCDYTDSDSQVLSSMVRRQRYDDSGFFGRKLSKLANGEFQSKKRESHEETTERSRLEAIATIPATWK
ncbi:hypothetical protein TNCV_4820161 [Trichonephila clavipes]|nr:hypothetical protein TNCV_4820161 [Trichonephila clavipes]